MTGELFYLASSFWLGALHAATPGHGKTIAAAYIVGARGRPVDALVLGIFVTLSHTSGIVLVAVLATLGSTWLVPHRIEAYLAVVTGLLVIGIGLWLVRMQWVAMPHHSGSLSGAPAGYHRHGIGPAHTHDVPGDPGGHHQHGPGPAHTHDMSGTPVSYHRHGFGPAHTHDIPASSADRPRLAVLLGLGIAGGLLPDPGALAVLLAALASGKVMLGLFTVLLFSLGFASVLVLVGIVAARVGTLVLAWLDSRWMAWLQVGTAALIVLVGVVLTVNAVRTVIGLT